MRIVAKLIVALTAALVTTNGITACSFRQEAAKDKSPKVKPLTELQNLEDKRDDLNEAEKYKDALALAMRIVETLRKTKPFSSELGKALEALAHSQSALRQFDSAGKNLDESLRILTKTDGPESQSVVETLNGQAWNAMRQNQFDKAEMLWKRALELEGKLIPGSLGYAACLSSLGVLDENRGLWKSAQGYFERVLTIREKLAPKSLVLAEAMVNLAATLVNTGQLDSAEKYLDRAQLLLRQVGADTAEMGGCLRGLATLAYIRGQLDGASDLFERSQKIFEKLSPASLNVAMGLADLGLIALARVQLDRSQAYSNRALEIFNRLSPDDATLFVVFNNLGLVERIRGHMDKAQEYAERAVAISERLNPGSLNLALALVNLGSLAMNRGHLEEAQKFCERALAIQEKQAPGSRDVAASLTNLGALAARRGRLEEAVRYTDRALEIQERISPNSTDLAPILNNLGGLATTLGDMERAEGYFDRAVAIQERFSPASMTLAAALSNLGNIAFGRGRSAEAEAYYERALEMYRKVAPGTVDESIILGNLGNAEFTLGHLVEAQVLYLQAVAIREKVTPDTPDTAAFVLDLGIVAYNLGKKDEAQKYMERALAITEKTSPCSLQDAVILADIGAVADSRGRFVEAEQVHERALKIKEQLAPGSLTVAVSLNNLGNIAWRQGRQKLATKYLRDRTELALSLAVREGSSGSDVPAFADETARIYSELGRESSSKQAVSLYGGIASLRGLGLELESRAKAVERDARKVASLKAAIQKRDAAVKAESKWVQGRTAGQSDKGFEDKLLSFRTETEKARDEVTRILRTEDPRLAASPVVTADSIRSQIPAKTELIEYVKVGTWDAKKNEQTGSTYAAYVLTRNHPPMFIQLGDAAEIDAEVGQFGSALNKDGGEFRHLSRALYNQLVKPLGKLPRNVLITPDGTLHNLPFCALQDGSGRYLVETKAVSVLGGGRDLVERPARATPGPSAVIAAPQYDVDLRRQSTLAHSHPTIRGAPVSSRGGRFGAFEKLPGALTEGKLVANALKVTPVLGADATEDRLYSLIRPRVLHIATHGVFFPPLSDPNRAHQALEFSDSMAAKLSVADDPMLRSALILAGANQANELRKKGLNDGWATALDISQMDLAGTELVVLSGCDTGRGDYKGAEGVYGLQRAFRFAGAQTLIMSLFSVPDVATQKLMASFYKNWKPGMPAGSKLKALRKAQLELLHNSETRSPKNWAGFVLMGDR